MTTKETKLLDGAFGGFLKALREKKNLSLREVEQETGVSNSFLSQIESGKRGIPGMKVINKLSKVFGPEIWSLVNGIFLVPANSLRYQYG